MSDDIECRNWQFANKYLSQMIGDFSRSDLLENENCMFSMREESSSQPKMMQPNEV